MSEERPLDYERLGVIRLPTAMAEEQRIAREGRRFVHYTSAQSALEILKSQCIWMRNATCMNDYNEMRHGLNCITEAFHKEAGQQFRAALEGCHAGLFDELDAKFTDAAPWLLEHTYLTCISEHLDDEELYGRLSMWRAYGSTAGVALIFNNGPFLRSTEAVPLFSGPVAYVDASGWQKELLLVAQQLKEHRDFVARFPRDELLDFVFRSMVYAVVGSKHEGFREEREWRVVHLPFLPHPNADRLPLDHVSLGGIPQPIFKIPFVDYPDEGFYGATVPDLIARIIIGPTPYAAAMRTAFAQILGKAGVENPLERVHCSSVSLRV